MANAVQSGLSGRNGQDRHLYPIRHELHSNTDPLQNFPPIFEYCHHNFKGFLFVFTLKGTIQTST